MKTILLLGGFGFIGSNILSYIDEHFINTYEVIVFDKYLTHYHGLNFKCVKKVYAGDFSNENNIASIFQENQIDLIFHALSSTVPSTSQNAQYDVESNLIPTLRLLELMIKYHIKDIVYLSSGGAIYGDFLQKVHNEEDAVYPKSSYGIIKLAIEKYLLSYSELYGLNTLILRLSNPYGRFHYNEKQGIINIAIRKALKKEIFQIWGTGNGIKDYIFIEDVCEILFQLISGGVTTNVFNVASGNANSVNDIIQIIKKQIPSFSSEHIQPSLLDIQNFELDITKLRKQLGGYKFTSFQEGIKQTINWESTIINNN